MVEVQGAQVRIQEVWGTRLTHTLRLLPAWQGQTDSAENRKIPLKTLVYSVLFSTHCQCCIHKQVMTKAQRP